MMLRHYRDLIRVSAVHAIATSGNGNKKADLEKSAL